MPKTRKRKLIEIPGLSKDQYPDWKIGLDKCSQNLKPHLEKLGFSVFGLDSLLDRMSVHELLLESKVNLFITTRGGQFLRYCRGYSGSYNLLWISQHLLDDPARTAKAVEGAILYNSRMHYLWSTSVHRNYRRVPFQAS